MKREKFVKIAAGLMALLMLSGTFVILIQVFTK